MIDQDLTLQVLFLVALIILSAVFSSAETSLTSLTHLKRKKLLQEKRKNAHFIEKLYEKPGKMLTTILVGNNIVNILASIVATFIFVQLLASYGIHNQVVATTLTTIVMTIIILIIGEITPKTMAIKNSERFGIVLGRPIYYLSIVLSPIINVLNMISKFIIKLTGGKKLGKGSLVSEEEIKILINMGLQEGILEKEEEQMLNSIIEFGDIVVREVMTPRTAIAAVDERATARKVINIIRRHGHSRIPVFSENIDNIIGFVYAKDLLMVPQEDMDSVSYIKRIYRDPYFVPESKKVADLLREMRINKKHIAVVIDEYGGVSGLVTIEDLIEEIIGEIRDEYDKTEEELIKRLTDHIFLVNGRTNVGDVNRELNLHIPESEDYDSIAGFIVNKVGDIPEKGEILEETYEDIKLKFIIINVIKRRITKVKIEIMKEGEDSVNV